MRYLLNAVYLVLLMAYLPIIAYQRVVRGKKRPGILAKFLGRGPKRDDHRQRILFHAVSLGEINAIRTAVNEFSKRHPSWEVVVSTTTQTGLDAARRQFPELQVCLMPFDFSWAVRRFLKNLKPDIVVLAELEIWPNLLAECHRQSISKGLINARLSERSLAKYQKFSALLGKAFQRLNFVCCQNETYAERFASLGVKQHRISVTGNLKYDALLCDREHPKVSEFVDLVQIKPQELVLIAGSTQAPEEQIAIEAFQQIRIRHTNVRLLICPRHPERFEEVASMLKGAQIDFTRRSHLGADGAQGEESPVEQVVLLDCMGELSFWWGVGNIAFVGGSFGNRGGQNMIEPLALGNAVCFGPNTRNFSQEVSGLIQYEAAVQLADPSELTRFLDRCLEDEEYRAQLASHGHTYLQDYSAGEQKAWQLCLEAIDEAIEKLMGDSEAPPATQAA